ncbi:MAG: hypothetical protein MN733_03910 [Nitrososphaera sp.]|nr:hypothetical protein [Nitrososphaera sp.]
MAIDKEWKRSKYTTAVISQVREAIRAAGYEEECAVVPLLTTLSVLARKGDAYFNLRLDKETLKVVETAAIEYRIRKDRIQRVFRKYAQPV